MRASMSFFFFFFLKIASKARQGAHPGQDSVPLPKVIAMPPTAAGPRWLAAGAAAFPGLGQGCVCQAAGRSGRDQLGSPQAAPREPGKGSSLSPSLLVANCRPAGRLPAFVFSFAGV